MSKQRKTKEYVPVQCIVNAGGGRCYVNWNRNHPQCVLAHIAAVAAAEMTDEERQAARVIASAERSAKRLSHGGAPAGKLGVETRQGFGPGPAAT